MNVLHKTARYLNSESVTFLHFGQKVPVSTAGSGM